MIFTLTAPNWERPSPDYGSHIIMSISGIYLLTSIVRVLIMAHKSSCPFLAYIYLYQSTHNILNSGARDNIFPSHTMSRQIYVCSLQQPGTD